MGKARDGSPAAARAVLAALIATLACAPESSDAPGAAQPSAARPPRPNVVFILSDDHAAAALSCYGSRLARTPHLDRLAAEGVRFDRAFVVNSICTPSRATILTGRHSHGNGVPVFNRFDPAQATFPQALRAAGYFTGLFGKWHLGSEPQGFDRWKVLPGQGDYRDSQFVGPEGRARVPGYVTDAITDLALGFLDERPRDRPFLLLVQHKAPHRPWDPDPRHAAAFADAEFPEPPTLRDDYATRGSAAREADMTIARHLTRRDLKGDPPAGLDGDALLRWKYRRYLQDYLACAASLDENVGRLLDRLDREGLARDTLVVYASDNGFFLGEHGWYDKRFMYEPALRIPLLARWPAVAPAGASTDLMALNLDLAATFADAAGVPPLPGDQGRSLLPLLRGERPADWRRNFYYRYYHDPGDHDVREHYGVRTETHKLIRFPKSGESELYDLVADPDETRNLFDDPRHADLRAAMEDALLRAKEEAGDDDRFAGTQLPYGADLPASRPGR